MSFIRSLVFHGLHPAVAKLLGNVGTPVVAGAAAGSTQATAAALTGDSNYITTVAASQGVILPAFADDGDEILVVNAQATNALLVYPPTGAAINGLAANAGYTVAVNKGVRFCRLGPLIWAATGA